MNTTTNSREEFHGTAACHAGQSLSRRTRRVLIVDNDLGFLLWLSKTLVEAGYAAFPAGSVENATALAGHLSDELEVLVVNPGIRHAGELIRRLRSRHPMLKVIALPSNGRTQALPVVDGSLAKENANGADVIRLLEDVVTETVAADPQRCH